VKPGDLVKFDMPGDPHRGKVGVVIGKELRKATYLWNPDSPGRFSYDVMIDGAVRNCYYQELLEEKDWGVDETR
jgi:hypothetical protein